MTAALILTNSAYAEESLRLDLPIDCVLGETCVVQNYVDRDPENGATDFQCGHLTYDGHKGTDFRVTDLARVRRGVAVSAAAAGLVVAVRNGMRDVNFRQTGAANVNGRDCGNGVRIDHDAGWVTQYCHLRKDSLRVKPGDRVQAGQVLGLVGLSGRTEFPHLHFEVSLRGRTIDPFVGPGPRFGCRLQERPIWRDARANGLAYRSVGLIDAGFTTGPPAMREIENGGHRAEFVGRASGALVFWVRVFGRRPGDVEKLHLQRPDGSTLVRTGTRPIDRPKAVWMSYSGKRRPKAGEWPAGVYRGTYTLKRNGRTLVSVQRSIEVR